MNILIKHFTAKFSLLVLLLASMLTTSCTEELSIADFADDFENYEQELRIEGVLDAGDFSKSIIRVDHTVLVTDTSLFNGIDDNGDWESYTDENGNNRWDEGEPLNDDIGVSQGGPDDIPEGRGNGIADPGEPHVDDYIEILTQVHDSTMVSVILREANSGTQVAEFEWTSRAAAFDVVYGPGGPPEAMKENPIVTYFYGAYVPKPAFAAVVLDQDLEYEMVLTTTDGRVISATTDIAGPPVNVAWENAVWIGDTLVSESNNYAQMIWNNSSETGFCAVLMDEVIHKDSTKGFYASLAVAINRSEDNDLLEFQGNFIGVPLGLYTFALESYTSNYGNYVYSGLPIRDRELSSWRDQDGNVVLGALGAKTPINFYLRLISPIGSTLND